MHGKINGDEKGSRNNSLQKHFSLYKKIHLNTSLEYDQKYGRLFQRRLNCFARNWTSVDLISTELLQYAEAKTYNIYI